MLKLNAVLRIGDFQLKGLTDLDFTSSWDKLTTQGKLIIPRNITFEGQPIISPTTSLFDKGDPVVITAGYDKRVMPIFEGVVTMINPERPLVFDIEDYMWILKQTNINKTYRSVTITELTNSFTEALSEVDLFKAEAISFVVTGERTLNKFRIPNETIAQVLERLRKLGVYSFFRGTVCYIGLAAVPAIQATHKILFEKNIIDDSLQYQIKDDIKVRIKVVIMSDSNEKFSVEVGPSTGALRTYHDYNMSRDDAEAMANQLLEDFQYSGYTGKFTTFGEPFIQHGDIVELTSRTLPSRNGDYLVKSVQYRIGMNGYRQVVELDKKIG